jgi:hypothetical protein
VLLTRCRDCDSRLLQLERFWLMADRRWVAERYCPECDSRDSVAAPGPAIAAWARRERAVRHQIKREAAELAS